ncbi:GATA zinc finger domain-containing protein 14-like [Copidosoma floridanum]|uniref:GATA zinc finger domain-containing protein 14-like n=1 Tax=Copidosoma floridanum TaxID=29053 RepID=UPI0006C9B76E|nr:GATA zinc finger domain-containing protein 14-like [Copidosoma floridanum]
MARLKIIKQQNNESIEDYGGRVQHWYNRLMMLHDSNPNLLPIQKQMLKESVEAEAVRQFTYGLQPTFRRKITSLNPRTLCEAIIDALNHRGNDNANNNNYKNYNKGNNNGPMEPYNANNNYYSRNNHYNNRNNNYNDRNDNFNFNNYKNYYRGYNNGATEAYNRNNNYNDRRDTSNHYGNDHTNQDSRDGYNRNFIRPGPPQNRGPLEQRNGEYGPDNRRNGSAAFNSQDVRRGPQTPSMN